MDSLDPGPIRMHDALRARIGGGHNRRRERPAVHKPDDEARSREEGPVCSCREEHPGPPPADTQDRQPLRLEPHVQRLVVEDAITQCPEPRRRGGVLQGGVVDLSDHLGRDQNGDRQLEPGQLAKLSEHRIGPGSTDRAEPLAVEHEGQVPGVPLLLGDEQPDRIRVRPVTELRGVGPCPFHQVASLRALAKLEPLDRTADGPTLNLVELGRPW